MPLQGADILNNVPLSLFYQWPEHNMVGTTMYRIKNRLT